MTGSSFGLAVGSVASTAFAAFLCVLLLFGRFPPKRRPGPPDAWRDAFQLGPARLLWQGFLASACLVPAAAACIVVPGFLLVYGPASLRASLHSAARNLDAPLVTAAGLGISLALFKTRLLLATAVASGGPRLALRIAADAIATVILTGAMAGLHALAVFLATGHGRAAYLPGHRILPLVPFLRESMADLVLYRNVQAAILCLPLAASGSFWAYAASLALVPRHVALLTAAMSAAVAACWAALFFPF